MRARRVAIIGTGFGVRTQLPGFRMATGWDVVSLTGRDPERTRRLADTHSVPHALGEGDDPNDVGDPDLVCVTTPPNLHLEQGVSALDAGRHCLLEKPMAMDAAEADALAQAAASDRFALLDHELRALPAHQEMGRRIAAGDVGAPLEIRVRFASHGRARPGTRWNWLARASDGGGVLGAIGSHVVDMIRWWLGDVRDVRARLSTIIGELPDAEGRLHPVETDDVAELLLTFVSGVRGTITLTTVAHHYEGIHWDVHGTDGSLWLDGSGRLHGGSRTERDSHDLTPEDPLGPDPVIDGSLWARGFVLLAGDLRDAIGSGASVPYAATFEDGRHVQRVLDAARRSAHTATPVTVANVTD